MLHYERAVTTSPHTLIVWKLDRLGRGLRHLINVVHDLSTRSIGFKVLTGHGASIDTTTSAGKLVFSNRTIALSKSIRHVAPFWPARPMLSWQDPGGKLEGHLHNAVSDSTLADSSGIPSIEGALLRIVTTRPRRTTHHDRCIEMRQCVIVSPPRVLSDRKHGPVRRAFS
jgi:hypothetical protein